MTAKKTQKPVPKAPAPRGRKRTHTKPAVPKEIQQAEKVAMVMYSSLKAPDAPRASSQGYIIGATMTLKMLFDQAVKQGDDHDELKGQIMAYIQMM